MLYKKMTKTCQRSWFHKVLKQQFELESGKRLEY